MRIRIPIQHLPCRLGEKEPDVKDRLVPSITYLQRLSPDYMDTVFQYSRWIFDENAEMALEVSDNTGVFYHLLRPE